MFQRWSKSDWCHSSTSMWLSDVRFECCLPLWPLILTVCGIIVVDTAHAVPREVNTPTHMLTDQTQSRAGKLLQVKGYTPMERKLLWWNDYCLENKHTQTHSDGLIWTVIPSISPTHTYTVMQHNGPVCTHSDIQLTLESRNKTWGRTLPLDLYSATNLPTLLKWIPLSYASLFRSWPRARPHAEVGKGK